MDVKDLEEKYRQMIDEFLKQYGDSSLLSNYLKLKDGKPRFWNCVSIERANNAVLWASINPSGSKKGDKLPEENDSFNQEWNYNSPANTYWGQLIQKIMPIKDVCGHIDLLPVHVGNEEEVRKMLFTTENTPERALAVELLKESQKMIEDLKPQLIIYSNASTAFLWGTNANRGIYWMGYKLEEIPDYQLKCWEKGKGSRKLYQIVGIHEQSIKDRKQTDLEGTYLLIDYQVGGRQESASIKKEEVKQLWEWVKKPR